jgi:hypothetical protein
MPPKAKKQGEPIAADRPSLFPIPCSLFPIPCSLFPVPYSLFPVPCSLFPIPYFLKLKNFVTHDHGKYHMSIYNLMFIAIFT